MSTAAPTLAIAARPVTGWRRLLSDAALVTSAGVACDALGAVTSILLRTLLAPAEMGVWQGLKLCLNYGNFANLGASKGAAREVSQRLGRGDREGARQAESLGFTANVVASSGYAFVMLLLAAAVAWRSDAGWSGPWAWGLAAVALLTLLQRHVTYQITLLRSRQRFGATSLVAMLDAVLTLSLGWWATSRWGLVGLCGATLAVLSCSALALRALGVGTLGWTWQPRRIAGLMSIGAPILLAGVLAALFRTVDRWVILAGLEDGQYQLGCYSAALLVTTQLLGLGNHLAIVLAPRFSELFGRTGCQFSVAQLAARSLEPVAATSGLMIGGAAWLAPSVLGAVMPEYAEGLAVLPWLLPGVLCQILALPLQQQLIAVDAQRRLIGIVAIALIATLALQSLACVAGLGLLGVAAASSVGYALHLALVAGTSVWPALAARDRARLLAMPILLAVMPLMIGAALATDVGEASSLVEWWRQADVAWLSCQGGVLFGAWACMATLAWHGGGWRSTWNEEASS